MILDIEHREKDVIFLFFFNYVYLRELLTVLSVEGSPADKDNLEVGDEILEVNGKTLEDATHTEVISHIHQVSWVSSFSSKKYRTTDLDAVNIEN